MAEPTIRDVLSALSKMEARLGRKLDTLHVDMEAMRADMAMRVDMAAMRADMAMRVDMETMRVDLTERLDAIDAKLEVVRTVLESTRHDSRDLRANVTAIHKGLVRVVPKELPSQVRAKSDRPSKPAKRTARRR